ncbi:MAG: tripartite tricarboxylate transporter substrate binding protein [Alphaproteobacteria bacterium]|nr:tripartite tricarboxylate transporter substrate binding protein [Alphaproteobacteria bacterium]
MPHFTRAVLSLALLTLSIAPGAAQDYPTRPVRIVVGFPAGGGVDTSARGAGQAMAQGLGQSVIIENKPGAAGTIGAAEVARSAPDGYTLLVTPGGHSIFGAIFKSLPFDTVKSFDWISGIVTVPFFVVVPANSEFKSVSDIVAKAKAAPGTVTFGSAGQGTTHHLGIELLGNRTGSKFLHVPYRGDAPLITALLAGEVQFGLATPTLILENIKAGRLRALATTANERAAMLSDVPTVEQALQIQNYDVRTWFGMAGPAGLPAGVVTRLNGELGKGLASPEVRARLAGIGGEVAATTPAQMRDRVARELQTWTETVNQAGIEKQ